MSKFSRTEGAVSFDGPILGFDVDWSRGRVAAVVDGFDDIEQAVIAGDRVRPIGRFGASNLPPDGRGATSVALHPSEAVVATAGWDRPIRVWDIEPTMRMRGEVGQVQPSTHVRKGYWGAVWSRCGNYLDTHNLGADRGERFDWRSGELVATRWGHPGPIVRHPGSDLLALAVGAETSSIYFALSAGAVFKWLPVVIDVFVPCKVAFGAGTMAVVGGTTRIHVALFDFPSLVPRFTRKLEFVDEDLAAEFGVSQAVALAPDGSVLYVPGADGEVSAISVETGSECARWRVHSSMVTHLAHHPERGTLLSSALDGTLCLSQVHEPATSWDAEDEATRFVSRHEPTLTDPDAMAHGAMTTIDTPW